MADQTLTDHLKQDVTEVVQRLKTERDELRVRAHLLHAELQDDWNEMESKWDQLEEKMEDRAKQALHAVEELNDDLTEGIEKICEEITDTYKRLRK